MTKVIVNEAIRSMLHNLTEPLEFCDVSGRILGQFVPTFDPAGYEGLEPQISQEELQRRKQSKEKSFTTAEVLAHLEKL